MAENRSRFVLLCQQSLAFGLVAAVAAPAAGVVTMDIVAPPRGAGAVGGVATPAVDAGAAGAAPSLVASRPVRPTVSSVPLGGVSRAGLRALRQDRTVAGAPAAGSARLVSAERDAGKGTSLTVLSAPESVAGLATVGVTWAPGAEVPDRAITIAVRTRSGAAWSSWQRMPYHEEEGPDPTSTEGSTSRPGTDPIYVGHVDDVQVKATTDTGEVPAGMQLSLVDPGHESAPDVEEPSIDTGELELSASETDPATDPTEDPAKGSTEDSTEDPTDDATLSAGVTSRPQIFSRRQWGADERMRDRSSLHYGEVHGGFVHHTVNANSYSRSQVPSIIRGIYAYHTQSRGWSDVGYNFLVDRFGRIWEGRAGGVDRPVVGAHTLGYNDDAFAMSAIGNYETTRPSAAVLDAYGRLFAWKLSLHGVRAGSTHQWVTKRYLAAIEGHRDVGQTACPGRYLYARIPAIRSLAVHYQRSFGARARMTNLVGIAKPDLVVRDRANRQAYLVRTARDGRAGRITATGTVMRRANLLLNAGDWNRDGHGDVITRSGRTGLLFLYRGNGGGRFAAPVQMSTRSLAGVRLLTAVGDMTGDGRPDLVGQPAGRALRIYPGDGFRGFRASYVAHSAISAGRLLGVNLWNSDGAPDTVARRSDGTLVLYPGNGPGGLTGGRRIGFVGRPYDWVVAVGDLTGDGRTDLVARASATGRLWTLPGTSSGFGARRGYAGDTRRFDLVG
jgi:hypothetical protein